MTVRKNTLVKAIETRTELKVAKIKKAQEVEELGRPIIYFTAELIQTERILGNEISRRFDCKFIYNVDFDELLDSQWRTIGE